MSAVVVLAVAEATSVHSPVSVEGMTVAQVLPCDTVVAT